MIYEAGSKTCTGKYQAVTIPFSNFKGYINGHEWVEMGPNGLKWATMNVGANSPEESGVFYAFGESAPKDDGYYYDNYTGNTFKDTATENWAGTWRMPTRDELSWLKNNCTWVWATVNNMNGYWVTNTVGNSIFFPAAGYYTGTQLNSTGFNGTNDQGIGRYWTSTKYSPEPKAYYLSFDYSNVHDIWVCPYEYGYNVRAVSD